ncbi:MAG: hypothetical protein KDA72_15015 [Planctomycetales bacterium]|nr:hypothetical protein [Planctomycetales bacterium]
MSLDRTWVTRGTLVVLVLSVTAVVWGYASAPWPNGPWSAADHNRDGILTRQEMQLFGTQKSHRNGARLLMHFDLADTNGDQQIEQSEIDAYGIEIGSRDPQLRGKIDSGVFQ